MGLLSGMVFGPVKLVTWTAERILEVAEAQRHDEPAIMAELADLNDRYDRGLVDDETFATVEDELLRRLQAARAERKP